MKKIALILAAIPALTLAGPYSTQSIYRNSTDTGNIISYIGPPASAGVIAYDLANNAPYWVTLGSSLSITAGVLDAAGTPQVNSDWNASLGVAQILNKPTNVSAFTNDANYVTSSSLTTTLGGYATTTALTTGLAGKFNSPSGTTAQYVRGDGTLATLPSPGSGTVTSVAAGTGLSGGTITTTGTISMPNVGAAGSYSGVTTDAQGRVTGGTNMSINDNPSRSLVTSTSATGFQISSTRNSRACYEGSFSTTSTIGGPASASVFIETADTNSTTPSDWTTKAQQTYTNTITLAVVLNQVQGNNWSFCRDIPAGKFVRIRSGNISGTASVTINATQQETTY